MPRFYLQLNECGKVCEDEDGTEFTDLESARMAAIHGARDVMCGGIMEGRLCLSCRIDVLDEGGIIRTSVPFTEAVNVTGARSAK